MSKKDALTLGILAIGGVAAASAIAGGGSGGGVAPEGKKGGILGSAGAGGAAPTIYNLPAQGAVTFPAAPTYDFSKFLSAPVTPETVVSRGTAGVSSAGKQTAYVKPGAYVAPKKEMVGGKETYMPATTFASALGTHRALEVAKSYGGGTSKKSDYIPSQWRTREGKEITRSKGAGSGGSGSSDAAKKAISHAKRLRAGRGD